MGLELEPSDVSLEPVVPGMESGLDGALAAYADTLAERVADAARAGEVLRYVAEIDASSVRVGLRAVPQASPIGSLSGPDNILVFRTARYRDYPLVIQGPGAGASVTAAGVLGDVLRVAASTN
jgi:homoserine dehydrogenase